MRHLFATVALVAATGTASAQSLESRVAAARGTVGFEYATRADVCGDGMSITVATDTSPGWTTRSPRSGIHIGTRDGGRYERCETGPARVLITRLDGEVIRVRVTVGGRPERPDTELGEVPAADASRYLLDLAPRLGARGAEQAVMGAAIAEGVVIWRRLLEIARNNDASEPARKASIFWLSQEVTVAAVAGLDSIATDDDGTVSVRADAVFYLAQRPNGEGIPALLRVVETSKSMRLRKDAIFYLAQSRDRRALDLFERLLAGR